jgi:hypothetical protein
VQVGGGKFIAAHLHIAFSPLAGQSTPRGKNIPANRENGPFLAKLRNMSPLTRQSRPHRSVDLVSGPRLLEAKRYEGRSNLGITNQPRRRVGIVKGALCRSVFAQHVRAIHPFAACRHFKQHCSRRFQTPRHAFIEAFAQTPQPFGNSRRLDRPISQHDAGLRLFPHSEGLNGNAEIKGS